MSEIITNEELEAVKEYVQRVETVTRLDRDATLDDLWQCGCRGPLPECACMRRQRLVKQFMEKMDDGS